MNFWLYNTISVRCSWFLVVEPGCVYTVLLSQLDYLSIFQSSRPTVEYVGANCFVRPLLLGRLAARATVTKPKRRCPVTLERVNTGTSSCRIVAHIGSSCTVGPATTHSDRPSADSTQSTPRKTTLGIFGIYILFPHY